MQLLKSLIYLLSAMTFAWGGDVQAAGRRVALVIGNSDYKSVAPLKNPKNDAVAVAAALKRLDFEVLHYTDLTQQGVAEPLSEFVRLLASADVALFYYAGHALSFEGRNYLVPIDASAESHVHVRFQMTQIDMIAAEMAQSARLSIILLDACRNNVFTERIARSLGTRSAESVSRGLAKMSLAGKESVIAYATSAGQVAEDGAGENSPFTAALLENIEREGAEIEQVLRDVRRSVREKTSDRQQPEYWNRLDTTFSFKPGQTTAAAPPPAAAGPSPGDLAREDRAYWESVRELGDAALIKKYMEKYPQGLFVDVARRKLEMLEAASRPQPAPSPGTGDADKDLADALQAGDEASLHRFIEKHPTHPRAASLRLALADRATWKSSLDQDNVDSYERYLLQFPDGSYASLAKERIAELTRKRFRGGSDPAPAPAPEPRVIEKEVIVEKPVYIEKPVYMDRPSSSAGGGGSGRLDFDDCAYVLNTVETCSRMRSCGSVRSNFSGSTRSRVDDISGRAVFTSGNFYDQCETICQRGRYTLQPTRRILCGY